MKYQLLRDLPFAIVGTEVKVYSDHTYIAGDIESDGLDLRSSIYLGQTDVLLTNGWIEEVKPIQLAISDFSEIIEKRSQFTTE